MSDSQACETSGNVADGEVVWFWHPLLMLSPRGGVDRPDRVRGAVNPRGDGDKKELVAGKSTKDPVKTIAQGRPVVPARTCGSAACFLLHADHGCDGHPAFPAPSFFPEGHDHRINSGRTSLASAKLRLDVSRWLTGI
jgi:hypothetical protein